MKKQHFHIQDIPAILYGSNSDNLYLYVHGKLSNKEEAGGFAEIVASQGYDVLSFDLPEHGERKNEQYECTVQNCVLDLKIIMDYIKERYSSISLYACSLGAYFSLIAYRDIQFEKCLFVSPILDMERLIRNMMIWAGVAEDALRERKLIETSFGETLSWDYYQYVKDNLVENWDSETNILYGENDNLTERTVLDSFSKRFNCAVDIMACGEHYFQSKEQLEYLENWIKRVTGKH